MARPEYDRKRYGFFVGDDRVCGSCRKNKIRDSEQMCDRCRSAQINNPPGLRDAEGNRIREQCWLCGQHVLVNKDGTLSRHRINARTIERATGRVCLVPRPVECVTFFSSSKGI
jgi:hypothetical protein